MNPLKVGIIAGTPVDTRFGRNLLESAGIHCVTHALSPTPGEQTRLQVLDRNTLTEIVIRTVREWEM